MARQEIQRSYQLALFSSARSRKWQENLLKDLRVWSRGAAWRVVPRVGVVRVGGRVSVLATRQRRFAAVADTRRSRVVRQYRSRFGFEIGTGSAVKNDIPTWETGIAVAVGSDVAVRTEGAPSGGVVYDVDSRVRAGRPDGADFEIRPGKYDPGAMRVAGCAASGARRSADSDPGPLGRVVPCVQRRRSWSSLAR
uniref:Uncharacterized protein n=1 Tax=Mycena chlorophos TaxID=658473 RepID=A0ABQ0KX21_MYCCL|nr:predicted protein [Mycena chlorophos]